MLQELPAMNCRRTEEAYVHWIRRFTLFHAAVHPRELYGQVLERAAAPISEASRARLQVAAIRRSVLAISHWGACSEPMGGDPITGLRSAARR